MRILNLTQHVATPDQVAAGVVEPQDKEMVKRLLTFNELPSHEQLIDAADELAEICLSNGCTRAMIGGAPFFMSALEASLASRGIKALYSFSKREVVEEPQGDGTVKKTAVFRHIGFFTA